jgi:glutamyl-tRNA reductase
MNFGTIGTSIWQQNTRLLEALTIDRDSRGQVLSELKQALGVDELIYLATCNRVEFIYYKAARHDSSALLHRLIDYFFKGNREISFFPNDFYHFTGREAIAHLFRLTSSLESMVIGEAQIAGQMKDAVDDSSELGILGPMLQDAAEEALLVAKRVKRETALGWGSVSMASLANDELARHLENTENNLIAIIGAGPMTRKTAQHISDSGLGQMLFVNRTVDKVIELAETFGGEAVSLEDFLDNPGGVSAIISATAAREPVFKQAFLTRLEQGAQGVICIDLAIPRDFAECFSESEKIKLVDIPYLRSKCDGNLRQKFIETSKASDIVRDAVNEYLSRRIEGSLKPIFRNSFEESLELCERAFEDLFKKKVTSLTADEQQAILRLMTKLVGHATYQPARWLSEELAQSQADASMAEISSQSKRKAV